MPAPAPQPLPVPGSGGEGCPWQRHSSRLVVAWACCSRLAIPCHKRPFTLPTFAVQRRRLKLFLCVRVGAGGALPLDRGASSVRPADDDDDDELELEEAAARQRAASWQVDDLPFQASHELPLYKFAWTHAPCLGSSWADPALQRDPDFTPLRPHLGPAVRRLCSRCLSRIPPQILASACCTAGARVSALSAHRDRAVDLSKGLGDGSVVRFRFDP